MEEHQQKKGQPHRLAALGRTAKEEIKLGGGGQNFQRGRGVTATPTLQEGAGRHCNPNTSRGGGAGRPLQPQHFKRGRGVTATPTLQEGAGRHCNPNT